MTPEKFKKHALFEKLEQLNQRLNDKETTEKIDIENLSFFNSVFKYISGKIKLTIPLLVEEDEINVLSNEINAGLQQINEFLGNDNVGHLTNATNNFYRSLSIIKNFPLPFAKNDFNFSKSISEFQDTVTKEYKSLEAQNVKLTQESESFKLDLEEKEKEIKRLFKLIESEEAKVQNLNTNFQTEFNNIKSKYEQDFSNDRTTFRNEIESDKKIFRDEVEALKDGIDTETSNIIKSLSKKLSEAKRVVNVIGNVGVTGNYQIIANEHKKSADFWRWVAMSFMAVLSGLLVWTIIDLAEQGFDWTKSLIRIIGAVALSYPATYAARESTKHRKLETINRTAELELASINPFIETLDDTKKQEIKAKLVEKYFGNNNSSIDNNDKGQEDVSIGGFEKIIQAILPLLKK